MPSHEFSNADDAIAFLKKHLSSNLSDLAPSSEPLAIIAADLLPMWLAPVETIRPSGTRGAHIGALNWVIRDDDLKVLDTILDSLKASAGAGFFVFANIPLTATMVATAGLVTGVLKLAYNAITKGVHLTRNDYSVISALIGQLEGLTEEELLNRLLGSQPNWTIEAVRSALATLSGAPSRSGKIALVWKSNDERWRTAGV